MYRLLSEALDGYQSTEALPGGKGWRIKRSGRSDALVLQPGSGSYNAGKTLGASTLYVWDLAEESGDEPTQSSGSVTLGNDPLLVTSER